MNEMIEKTIRHMVTRSKLKFAQVGKRMGKSDTFLTTMLSKHSIPRFDTFLKLAKATGYSVVLVGHNEEITMAVEDEDEKEVVSLSSLDL